MEFNDGMRLQLASDLRHAGFEELAQLAEWGPQEALTCRFGPGNAFRRTTVPTSWPAVREELWRMMDRIREMEAVR